VGSNRRAGRPARPCHHGQCLLSRAHRRARARLRKDDSMTGAAKPTAVAATLVIALGGAGCAAQHNAKRTTAKSTAQHVRNPEAEPNSRAENPQPRPPKPKHGRGRLCRDKRVFVLASNATSCPFAVRLARGAKIAEHDIQITGHFLSSLSLRVVSPVTGRAYAMRCHLHREGHRPFEGVTGTCAGGHDAFVWFSYPR
jgi:hypothetical protein